MDHIAPLLGWAEALRGVPEHWGSARGCREHRDSEKGAARGGRGRWEGVTVWGEPRGSLGREEAQPEGKGTGQEPQARNQEENKAARASTSPATDQSCFIYLFFLIFLIDFNIPLSFISAEPSSIFFSPRGRDGQPISQSACRQAGLLCLSYRYMCVCVWCLKTPCDVGI